MIRESGVATGLKILVGAAIVALLLHYGKPLFEFLQRGLGALSGATF